jgi:flagellar hook protein FlgE
MIFVISNGERAKEIGIKMIYSMSGTLSALSAARKQLGVTANNIANTHTDKFKKSRVSLSEGVSGGVSANIDVVDTPGIPKDTIENDRIVQTESSNVDLAEELTEIIPTQFLYGANLKAMKTQNDMVGSLINIMG